MLIALGQRRWTVLPVAAGLTLLLLLGAVAAGLRVPGFSYLSGLPGVGLLDYRTLSGGAFAPLRADYLDELLGTGFGQDDLAPAGTATRPRTADAQVPGQPAAGPAAEGVPPVRQAVVDHELTNDDMADAIVITRLPFAARTNTSRASRQDEEPASCSPAGRTAWYRYTATRDGLLAADTFGSDHATALGVFTSTAGRPGQEVGCATSAAGGVRVPFSTRQGTTYLFQVSSVLRPGEVVFHLDAIGSTSLGSSSRRGLVDGARWAGVSGDGQVVVYEVTMTPVCKRPKVCTAQVYAHDRRTGRTELVSRSSQGESANDVSFAPSISGDGRYVSFTSSATNLVREADTNDARDVFVHDRLTGRTVRASVDSQGRQGTGVPGNDHGIGSSLSADGRYVTFFSALGGLVEDDPPGSDDVFVRDLRTGITTRESVDESGNGAIGFTVDSRVSRDGRFVAFLSAAQNLAPARYGSCDRTANPLGTCYNVFLRDRHAGTTRVLSVDREGRADMAADRLDMSDDGRVIAWTTTTGLDLARDTNGVSDVYVVDRSGAPPRRVSLSSQGEQQDDPGGAGTHTDRYDMAGTGRWVSVSGDGHRVAFDSRSTNLVPEDSNGYSDVFLRDLRTGVTLRVSSSVDGGQANGDSYRPSLSRDGSVVVFESEADNLVDKDDNRVTDVFVHDVGGV